jgi:hypothetical protein
MHPKMMTMLSNLHLTPSPLATAKPEPKISVTNQSMVIKFLYLGRNPCQIWGHPHGFSTMTHGFHLLWQLLLAHFRPLNFNEPGGIVSPALTPFSRDYDQIMLSGFHWLAVFRSSYSRL